MSGYIGNIPVPQATQTRQSFTATAGQTSFATGGYSAGYIDVYLNGIRLVSGTDYTAINGSDVVLTVGAAADDILDILAFTTFEVAGSAGGGLYKGENGTSGNTSVGAGDIFRVHEQELNTDVTIDATENAMAAGPLTVASGVTLTVTTGGNLSIV
jgi:hypothetical protein